MCFFSFSEEVILQPPLRPSKPPSKPPRASHGSSSESFKARLSTVVHMQNQHVQQNMSSMNSDIPSSSKHPTNYSRPPGSPQRKPPSGNNRYNEAPPVIPPKTKATTGQRLQPLGGNHRNNNHNSNYSNHNHGNLGSSHATLNTSWGEDSEPEYSDEDREYVYYVNASQV